MNIQVSFGQTCGKIKPVNGVGEMPIVGLSNYSLFHYLGEAGFPFSRLHDVAHPYGGSVYVDIPNLFRNFNADASNPDNYDFTYTDHLLSALDEQKVEPFFRLGVSIENTPEIKRYTTFPPKDNLQWAKICEGIIRHYTEGWGNGFYFKIRYWEIWNEPDDYGYPGAMMWDGTAEEFYDLYEVASTYLKERFPHLKIGGYGSSGLYVVTRWRDGKPLDETVTRWYDFFVGFLKRVKEKRLPLDFFSWHSYDRSENNAAYARYIRKYLDDMGYTETESILNEWNDKYRLENKGSYLHAVTIADMLTVLQKEPVDAAMFYDARVSVSVYAGLFNPLTLKPLPTYYSFLAFRELADLGTEAACECALPNLAATDGKKGCLFVVNKTEDEIPLSITADLPLVSVSLLSEGICYEKRDNLTSLPPLSLALFRFEKK